jgi:DNA polymerase-3 subunit delta
VNATELLRTLGKGVPAPVYLFLGPDAYRRREVRAALVSAVAKDADPDSAVTRLDLEETSIAAVVDDASSLSLFAPARLIWVGSAEAALPRRITAKSQEDGEGPAGLLAAYVHNPTPGTVVVFDCSRYGFEGEEKDKLDRVRKFYAAIRDVVEFAHPPIEEAIRFAESHGRDCGLALSRKQASLLVEALGPDLTRLDSEIRKLAAYSSGRPLDDAEIFALVPDARTSNVFALVNALAGKDRSAALEAVENLVREGEYLPLVLTFLGTQFRLAIAAGEANATRPGDIQTHFSKLGVPMWRSRAEQLAETMRVFPAARLKEAVRLTHAADVALRDTRPDDRTVMESFLLRLTN